MAEQAPGQAATVADGLTEEIAGMLVRIEANYERETSGPGSRFEGRRLEVVQAEAVLRRVRERAADFELTWDEDLRRERDEARATIGRMLDLVRGWDLKPGDFSRLAAASALPLAAQPSPPQGLAGMREDGR